jgi:tetratricopeptide (TPR) repeat protein
MKNWSRGDFLTFTGLLIAVLAILVSLTVPEIRQFLRLEKSENSTAIGGSATDGNATGSDTSATPNSSDNSNTLDNPSDTQKPFSPDNSRQVQSDNYMNQGAIAHRSGDLHKAIENYTQAINISPDRRDAYESRGAVYKDLGDYQKADADYRKAAELPPR